MQKNRLREIREQRGMLISDLEDATGIKAATISLQENHKRAIPVESAIIYCDFFKVSLDFLFCREEYSNEFEKYKTEQLKEFLELLEKEVKKRDYN